MWSELGVGTNFVLTLPRHHGPLDGPSPVPLEPQDEEREFDDATQPIELADIPSHLFDEGSL
ncbi:hypothetical protein D3C73_1624270 [compost metagenome]